MAIYSAKSHSDPNGYIINMSNLRLMECFRIAEIFKVSLEDILLELHFNLESDTKKGCISLCIDHDGESVLYSQKGNWITLDDIQYGAFTSIQVNDKDDLAKLLGNEIEYIQLGVDASNTTTTLKDTYYVIIKTNKFDFLFFNNGDKGDYVFDRIYDIIKADIYNCTWKEYHGLKSI